MRFMIVAAAVVALVGLIGMVRAAPQFQRQQRQSQDQERLAEAAAAEEEPVGDGIFSWSIATPTGGKHEQHGYIKNPEEPDPKKRIQVIEGSYTVISGGKTLTVNYIADENGYRATGDHLPKPRNTPQQ